MAVKVETELKDILEKIESKIDKLDNKVDGVKEEVSLLRGEVKALKTLRLPFDFAQGKRSGQAEMTGVNKRVDNQEFLNRATTLALVSAFFITILKALFPHFPGI